LARGLLVGFHATSPETPQNKKGNICKRLQKKAWHIVPGGYCRGMESKLTPAQKRQLASLKTQLEKTWGRAFAFDKSAGQPVTSKILAGLEDCLSAIAEVERVNGLRVD
jgi:hypothetical protein